MRVACKVLVTQHVREADKVGLDALLQARWLGLALLSSHSLCSIQLSTIHTDTQQQWSVDNQGTTDTVCEQSYSFISL